MQKKIIISVVISLVAFNSLFCQQLPYRHFSEFTGNIKTYLLYNFEERGQKLYSGSTFAQLIADLEINPLGYYPTTIKRNMNDSNGNTYSYGIVLFFTKKSAEFSVVKDDHLTIRWDTPVFFTNEDIINKSFLPGNGNRNAKSYNSIMELNQAYPKEIWVKQHFDFYKNLKIKSVLVNNLP